MLRIGIAGLGGLGTLHLKNLLGMQDRVVVAALADPIEDRRQGTRLNAENNMGLGAGDDATVGDVRSYPGWEALCEDPDLDVICIATPSDLHAVVAVRALENGKHVFTEKPMALNPADCARMIDAARAADRKLMVGQCLRFFPAYVKAKELMESGAYGKPVAAFMYRYGGTPRAGWFREVARSGGVSLDLHIHDIDAALWFWGAPGKITTSLVGALPDATAKVSRWEYENGPVVHLDAVWDAGSGFRAAFRIVMERGTLQMMPGGKVTLATVEGTKELELEGLPGHAAELHYFIDCVLENRPVDRCPPESSALAVEYSLIER